jgi:enterochelin esterase-like enzyme
MNKFLLIVLIFCVGSLPLHAQDDGGEVRQVEFEAPTLFQFRPYQYNVYLPAGYDESDQRYPVIYLLHGRGDDMSAWLNAKPALDELIAAGDIPPMIAIMPDVPALERASYYVDTAYNGGEPAESLFFNDLMPHVDATYRTLPQRESRLVGGYSMGGFGAIRYAVSHPELFAGALVLSPAVYTPLPPVDSSAREFGAFGDDDEPFVEAFYTSLNYPAQLERLAQSRLGLAMFIAVGDDEYHNPKPEDALHDIDMEAHLLYNRVVRLANVSAELRVYDGGHDWSVWERGFREGMPFLARFLSTSAPDPNEGGSATPDGTLVGTEGEDFAGGVAADADGNVYLALGANGPINGEAALGEMDAVIVKYAPDGSTLWTRQFGTPATERPYGIAVDSRGNVTVAGYTKGDFDGSHPDNEGDDAFVAQFSPDGDLLWIAQFGDEVEADRIYALAVAADDTIYVAGYTKGALAGENAGDKDVMLAKFSPDGEPLWTHQFGYDGEDKAFGLATGEDGRVYLAGVMGGSMSQQTGFVNAYSSEGESVWSHSFASAEFDWLLNGVSVSGETIYVTGLVSGEAEPDQHAGERDIFTAALDAEGDVRWSRQLGTAGTDVGADVQADAEGNAYVVAFTNDDLAGAAGGKDVVIVQYNADGEQLSIQQWGTPDEDGGDAYNEENLFLALNGDRLLVSGFTTGSIGSADSLGSSDVFLTTISLPE